MQHTTSFPSKNLHRFISSFDFHYPNALIEVPSDYSLLPLGTIQLLFQLETAVTHRTIFSGGWQNRPDVFLGGPYDKGYELTNWKMDFKRE